MVVLGVLVTFFGAVFLPVNCVQDTPSLVVSAVGVDDSGRFDMRQLASCGSFTLTARPYALGENRHGRENRGYRALNLMTPV